MKFKYIAPVKCIKCGKELKPLYDDSYDTVSGGIVDRIRAPYGSRHDGSVYQIGICDDCIDATPYLVQIGNYIEGTESKDTEPQKEENNA